jgi:hypothetical protein
MRHNHGFSSNVVFKLSFSVSSFRLGKIHLEKITFSYLFSSRWLLFSVAVCGRGFKSSVDFNLSWMQLGSLATALEAPARHALRRYVNAGADWIWRTMRRGRCWGSVANA